MPTVAFPTIFAAPVTQGFNNHNPALYGGDGRHKGMDFGIMPNSPIYACMSGRVTLAETRQTGYGRHIRVLHDDGSLGIYGHLNALLVQQGDRVTAGELIAKSGGDPKDSIDGDGTTTGPHLHWEIRPPAKHASDQTAVDPMLYCLQYITDTRRLAEVTAYSGLNVRHAPSATGRVLHTVRRKQIIEVVESLEGWARLNSLRPEWVSEKYIHYTGEIITPSPTESPSPSGEGAGGEVALTPEQRLRILWDAHPDLHP